MEVLILEEFCSEGLLQSSLFLFLESFFREEDGVLDLLNWEEEEVLDTQF